MGKVNNFMPIADLPASGTPEKVIYTKPVNAIIVLLAVGAVFLFTKLWVLGLLMIGLCLFAIFMVKGQKQLELYVTYGVLFPENKPGEALVFKYADVNEWGIRHEASTDMLTIAMKNDKLISIPVYNSTKMYKALNKVMPKQESAYVFQQRINEKKKQPSKFKWPWKKKAEKSGTTSKTSGKETKQ